MIHGSSSVDGMCPEKRIALSDLYAEGGGTLRRCRGAIFNLDTVCGSAPFHLDERSR